MTTILVDGLDCEVKATLRPGFCVADAGGAFAFASLTSDGSGAWEWWAGSTSAEDAAELRKIIEANGGFDRTSVVVVPPSEGRS